MLNKLLICLPASLPSFLPSSLLPLRLACFLCHSDFSFVPLILTLYPTKSSPDGYEMLFNIPQIPNMLHGMQAWILSWCGHRSEGTFWREPWLTTHGEAEQGTSVFVIVIFSSPKSVVNSHISSENFHFHGYLGCSLLPSSAEFLFRFFSECMCNLEGCSTRVAVQVNNSRVAFKCHPFHPLLSWHLRWCCRFTQWTCCINGARKTKRNWALELDILLRYWVNRTQLGW